ncbi:hypothetical protein C8A00DRAFT_30667 [Chaetomidium leptoderma]|uniref:C2H2-type domain-containing protein n=1 Tax=Chaetomidium leptoderma TaxID=669021 RepID=A0AAN6VUK3_9PEZI|nr:hypothetical protein C8A00DRAFT_30667 [Chaetomidium leptoderma]
MLWLSHATVIGSIDPLPVTSRWMPVTLVWFNHSSLRRLRVPVSDDARWLFGDSSALFSSGYDDMNTYSINLPTGLDVGNIPIHEPHTWSIEHSPVAHHDLPRDLAVDPVEVTPREPKHSQSTFDRSPAAFKSQRVESISAPNPIDRHVCDQCGKGFTTQNDADRHRRSIHEKATPYFYHEAGCRRAGRGFSRKDNYNKHLLRVHRKSSTSPSTGFTLRRVGKGSTVTDHDHGLEDYSRRQLEDMLVAELERGQNQQRELQEAKQELIKLKGRIEQREDMWLKVLVANYQGDGVRQAGGDP